MKQLLEIYLRYFEFLYADPRYRFTDSRTHAPNASLTVAGPDLTWQIVLDRGTFELSVSATRLPGDGFDMALIRQYLDGREDIRHLSAAEEIDWARHNLVTLADLFGDDARCEHVVGDLAALRRSNGEKYWGPAQPHPR